MKTTKKVEISPTAAILNGELLPTKGKGMDMVIELYRRYIGNYPKFFKMDALARVGFVASELLLKDDEQRFTSREDRAVVLFNKSSSICSDKIYQKTICDKNEYFPSPSAFVYTLPNIVAGEICIRNKYEGESCFYVLDNYDETTINNTITEIFTDKTTTSAIVGWVECENEDSFSVKMQIITLWNN
ncbi:MAG: hypothetical protein HUK06_08245 [Bacteroidaceae bacterium]|nr:hypothetical protein [Bacteroidaceae bacterium]